MANGTTLILSNKARSCRGWTDSAARWSRGSSDCAGPGKLLPELLALISIVIYPLDKIGNDSRLLTDGD